ncbi:uncharacterized protein G2W53_034985 [Senna tora]|uniref:Uncharacterized protein n=1 Tax=Senna tora TaxID=362788 RepID=A0A834SR22_9FABA|nr:uncharacterized protein G2W53_034985 [Senna tora]
MAPFHLGYVIASFQFCGIDIEEIDKAKALFEGDRES